MPETRRRIARAAIAGAAVAGVLLAAAPANAAIIQEKRNYTDIFGHLADYQITFYGNPFAQSQKHLVVADKREDGKAAKIRIWPSPINNPCSFIDYPDKDGGADNGSVASPYDIYYPVGMIAYVLDDRVANWNDGFGYNSSEVSGANC
jgi:hypothetical protein